MTPRQTALPVPTAQRYWVVAVDVRGDHYFRHPYYGQAAAMLAFVRSASVDPETDTRTDHQRIMDSLPAAGVVIGGCWHHRGLELAARFPADPTPEALRAYGIAVIDEMQDHDYTTLDVLDLFNACVPELNKRQSIISQAMDRVTFSEAREESSTTS